MADYTISAGVSLVDGAGAYSHVLPGDRLLLPSGTRGTIEFRNLVGSAGQPISVVNSGGQVRVSVSGSYGIQIDNCQHIRLLGGGHAGTQYGFYILGYDNCGIRIHNGTEYIEVARIRINGQWFAAGDEEAAGMRCFSETGEVGASWIQHETRIHDCLFENIGASAVYWGKGTSQDGTRMQGVYGYNNIISRTRTDGLQVRRAVADVEFYGNVISDCGLGVLGTTQGGAGLIVGEGTVGSWHGNYVENCDRGIQLLDHGNGVRVYENVFVGCGPIRDEGAIRVFTEASGVQIYNNTIVSSIDYGIRTKTGYGGDEIHSNLICASGGDDIESDGNVHDNCIYATVAAARFVDPAADDYRLQASSPARGNGEDGIDCGAFQFGEGPPPPPPPGRPEPPNPSRFLEPAFPGAWGAGYRTQGGR